MQGNQHSYSYSGEFFLSNEKRASLGVIQNYNILQSRQRDPLSITVKVLLVSVILSCQGEGSGLEHC